MNLYDRNIETLARYYPDMDNLIEQYKNESDSDLKIFEDVNIDGEKITKIQKDNKLFYLDGKRQPNEPARIWRQVLGNLRKNTPVFIFGVGNYRYLKELAENTVNRITIIVYEPSVLIFKFFLQTVNLETWMEKHTIIFWVKGLEGMDIKNFENTVRGTLTYDNLGCTKYLIIPNYEKLFYEDAVEFSKVCRDLMMREVVNYNTRQLFSGIMAKNLLMNARYLCDGYKTTQLVEVIPRNIPGIVVAAGPSLNKNIQEIKKAKGKSIIIAVDTAIKPLLNAGIIPDMFAVIDALKPLELVKMEAAKDIPLLTTLNAAPDILEFHRGKKFFFNEGYKFAEKIFENTGLREGDVSCGGSVATSIFSLLYKIGIDTIILVGQDLAYTNNKSHADGTFKEVMDEENTTNFQMVEGNYEEKVPTRTDFKQFLDWYNYYIEGCKEHRKNFRVINATEGGAKIKNTEIMTLKEAIKRECKDEVDIQQCLNQLHPMLEGGKREWTIGYLNHLAIDFAELVEDAKKLEIAYHELMQISSKRNINTNNYKKILKKIKKQVYRIEEKDVYQLVEITMNEAEYILRNEQFIQLDTIEKEGKEIARKGILYAQDIQKIALVLEDFAKQIFSGMK